MSIVLNSKTYTFAGFDAQAISHYVERSGGVPASFSDLTNRIDSSGTGNTKVRWKLKLPVVSTEDSACGCAGSLQREYIVDMVATVPAGSTLAERTDLQARIEDLVASAEFTASIISLLQASA